MAVCDAQHDLTYLNVDRFVARTDMPLLLTEFGGTGDPAVIARTLPRVDARFIGWQYWHYESAFGSQPGADPFTGELGRQLVRTYPQATAGVPGTMSYDAVTGEFAYTYTARPTTAPTEIYVSDLQYADGYAVALTGACAVSEPGARMLVLQHVEGATAIGVQVTAGTAEWPACPADADGDADGDGAAIGSIGSDAHPEFAGARALRNLLGPQRSDQ